MTTSFRTRVGKKLLVASVGIATLTIGACDETVSSGNLVAPPQDLGVDLTVGNLMAQVDAGNDAATEGDAGVPDADVPDSNVPDSDVVPEDLGVDLSVGNLLPPPDDAGTPSS